VLDDELPKLPSLSPSAADFKTCPLLYRFRTIDRIPVSRRRSTKPGARWFARCWKLFDLPRRSAHHPLAGRGHGGATWDRLREDQPLLAELFGEQTPDDFVASTVDLLAGYFSVEDPTRLEPAERESLVEAVVDDHLLIRGYIDRLDVSPGGDLRVVDYKTGGAPREAFEARALFQLKFYALVLWRTRGVVPKQLRLLYLKDAEVCDYSPDADELARFERTLVALWRAIDRATQERDFRPQPGRLCDWCSHQSRCPAFGGTPPPFPEPVPVPRAARNPPWLWTRLTGTCQDRLVPGSGCSSSTKRQCCAAVSGRCWGRAGSHCCRRGGRRSQAFTLVRRLLPDVVLLDPQLPRQDGASLTTAIVGARLPVRVLALTSTSADPLVGAVLRAGAHGVLAKDVPSATLVAALRAIAAGEATVLAPTVLRELLDAPTEPKTSPVRGPEPAELTDREREVLVHLGHGRSNAEIADRLRVSETTVKTHVGHVLTKLGLRDRVQVVVFAYESGLIQPGR
jgi:putative RecB family exonuclease